MKAPLPPDEAERLNALRRYEILDTPAEQEFDDITLLASHICGTPIALISLIDETRQWFKSKVGFAAEETSRDLAFCAHGILQRDVFIVSDPQADARFASNPAVTGDPAIRFYAGAPLVTTEGQALGMLCVIDRVRRELSPESAAALQALSRQVVAHLDLRRSLKQQREAVAELERTQRELSGKTAFLEAQVNSSIDGILVVDLQGKKILQNERLNDLLKIPRHIADDPDEQKQVEWVTSLMRNPEKFLERVMALYAHPEEVSRDEIELHDGSFLDRYSAPVRGQDGHCYGRIWTFRDITERKRAEESLRLLGSAVEQAKESILITDADLEAPGPRIVFVNPAYTKLTGYSAEEVIGKSPRISQGPRTDREVIARLRRNLQDGEMFAGDTINYRKDGSEYHVEWQIAPVRDGRGKITNFVAVQRDVTERKKNEEELRVAKESAEAVSVAKSRFLATMSHEIRTPMNGVIGMTSLLRDTSLDAEQRDFVETIRASGESLLTVINDILDFSKIEAGKLTLEMLDFDLQEVVEGTVELLAETAQRKGLELSGFTHPSVPTDLHGDAGRLRQVLTNLVGNGIKFTAAGEVALRVELVDETDTHATLAFRVRDTGIGIAPEAQPRLFQAFTQADLSTTRKFGGTGLGLAISRQLIESMGGEMGLESAPGAGSTFWFTLPLEKQPRATQPSEPAHALADARVLAVDDSATNRENLQTQLAAWKIASEVVHDAASALAALRAAARTASPFTVAMIDQEMPGMDGLDLARTIKRDPALAATRLVLLTARGQRLAEEELQAAGIVQSRLKPVRQSMLFDCLVNALADSPAIVAAASSPALPAQGRRKERVLLAEDNAVNQKVALGQLRKLGYAADPVGNGFEAIQALAQVPYDIVFMDCHMPELDGFEATAAIRQREGDRQHTWIIAMTANAMSGDREQCLAAGMDDYVSKPVRLDDLAAVLERAGRHLTAASPAIDPRSLDELRELPEEDGRSILQNLVLKFLEEAPAAMAELRAAVESADSRAVEFAAHRLKGSSSVFGAHRLQELCGEMECAGKAGQLEPLADLLPRTEAEGQRVLTALARELELQPT